VQHPEAVFSKPAGLDDHISPLHGADVHQPEHRAVWPPGWSQGGNILRQADAAPLGIEIAHARVQQPAVVEGLRGSQGELDQCLGGDGIEAVATNARAHG